ncbi:MAG: hypothetical protein ACOC7T_05955 [Planctomycetota bacterium]
MQVKESGQGHTVRFENGASVRILQQDEDFRGLGEVKLGRRKLRSGKLPIRPLIATPDGFTVSRLELKEMEEQEDALILRLKPFMVRTGRMEWLCCDGYDRWNVGPWDGGERRDRGGIVRIVLRPVERSIGGLDYAGFSYSYKFRSRKYEIFRIHDRATWELGGRATGNSLWMAGPFAAPRMHAQNKQSEFTTSWCRRGTQLQQFLPLFSCLQGFGFQFDRDTVLVTAFEEPFHCRSLFEKRSGENFIVHWHQLCESLGGCLEFPAQQVLCAPSRYEDEAERVNQYCAVREELHRRWGRRAAPAGPDGGAGLLQCDGAGARMVRSGLDRLADEACRRVFVSGFTPADGDEPEPFDAPRLTDYAHQRGMEVALPLAHCCRLAAPLEEPETAEPPPPGLAAARGEVLLHRALREESALDYLLGKLRLLRHEIQVDGVFAGSLVAEIGDDFTWIPDGRGETEEPPPATYDDGDADIRSLHGLRQKLARGLRDIGFKCTLRGVDGLAAPAEMPVPEEGPVGEFLFRDYVLSFPHDGLGQRGIDPYPVYFRGCAHRVGFAVPCRAAEGDLPDWWTDKFRDLNAAVQAVRQYMGRATALPEDRGVLWSGPDPEVGVLWTFRGFEYAVEEGAEVFDVLASRPVAVQEGGFEAQKQRVYLLQSGQGQQAGPGSVRRKGGAGGGTGRE